MIMAFDSTDELFAALDAGAAREEALAREVPDQIVALLQEGDCYVKASSGILIFGEMLPCQEEEDREYFARTPWMRWVKAASVVCVNGEMGTSSIVGLYPISREHFEQARERGWVVSAPEAAGWITEQISALRVV